jgi:hypothetical protein
MSDSSDNTDNMEVTPGGSLHTTGVPGGPGIDGKQNEPQFDSPKARPVTVRLVTNEADAPCSFWVGLSAPGAMTPSELMDAGQVPAMLFEAATKGMTENGPVMLSDTSVDPPRYVYLTPAPSADFRERAAWLQELIATIKSWAPLSAGFYISPELIAARDSHELLLQILRETITASTTASFYLLLGAHGLNSVLNAALRLKSELDSETLNVLVYH